MNNAVRKLKVSGNPAATFFSHDHPTALPADIARGCWALLIEKQSKGSNRKCDVIFEFSNLKFLQAGACFVQSHS
ncbi:hypothetical protein T01_7626 [Trichinella spiralis]|uniref:Uncharacterized protein n=1 Tax=Trichinella spiralis TaxID=6334 RepID=A0A0V1BDC2_TRISP|nr:hypothetical protein T01_7626 [Trichinella spiralis]